MDIKLEKQTLGSLARLSNVSTTEQVKSYVEGYIKEYSNNAFVHLSGDSNIGTLELSGDLKTTKIEANNAEFGRNNHAELCSVAEGCYTLAVGRYSHAEGNQTSALAYTSHAAGANAKAEHQNSYVWSGGSLYSSHDAGTFNINPSNGANGFYIGDKTLSDIIDSAIKEHDAKILKDIEFDTSTEQDIDYLVNTLSTIINKLGGTIK